VGASSIVLNRTSAFRTNESGKTRGKGVKHLRPAPVRGRGRRGQKDPLVCIRGDTNGSVAQKKRNGKKKKKKKKHPKPKTKTKKKKKRPKEGKERDKDLLKTSEGRAHAGPQVVASLAEGDDPTPGRGGFSLRLKIRRGTENHGCSEGREEEKRDRVPG